MRKIWIVVANGTEAKIYRAENTNSLVEHGILFNEQGHLLNHELVSDAQGRESKPTMGWADTYEAKTSPRLKEAHFFASTVSEFLEKGYNSGQCEKIYIIAKPPFLGHLRSYISPHIAKIVATEIHKDLTQLSATQIREYLPPVL